MKNAYSLALLVALSLAAGAVSAQYSWIGKDGRKVYSDQPPPSDIQDKQVLKRPSAPVPGKTAEPGARAAAPAGTNAAKPASDEELAEKLKQADEAEAARKKTEEERVARIKLDNCTRARQARVTYASGVPLTRVNERGEREPLSDNARQIETQRLDAIMADDCR